MRADVRATVTALLSLVASVLSEGECDETTLPLALPQRSWVPKGAGDYVGTWTAPKRFAACVERRLDDIRQRPEFAAALRAIESDERLGAYDGRQLGTPQSSARFDRSDFLVHVCVDGAQRFGRALAAEADALAERIVDALYADKVIYELVAPLPRFECPDLPIVLADDIRIDLLTAADLDYAIEQQLVEVQLHPPPAMQFGRDGRRILNEDATLEWAYVPASAAIYCSFTLPFGSGPYSKGQADTAAKLRIEAEAKLTALISALRVFKSGYVWFPGVVLRPRSWWLEGNVSIGWSERVPRGQLQLDSADAEAFRGFWSDLRSPKCLAAGWFGAAIRRFGFSMDRSRTEDKIVDVMIAFESLFLHDAIDELSYRLAVRVSSYAEEAGETRRALYLKVRDAYKARSAVVHGSSPKPGSFQSLDEMLEFLEKTFRMTVRRLAREIAGSTGPGDDWEAFILDSPAH